MCVSVCVCGGVGVRGLEILLGSEGAHLRRERGRPEKASGRVTGKSNFRAKMPEG